MVNRKIGDRRRAGDVDPGDGLVDHEQRSSVPGRVLSASSGTR